MLGFEARGTIMVLRWYGAFLWPRIPAHVSLDVSIRTREDARRVGQRSTRSVLGGVTVNPCHWPEGGSTLCDRHVCCP